MKTSDFIKNVLFIFAIIFGFSAALQTQAQTCVDIGGSLPYSYTQNFDGLGNSPAPQNGSANIFIINASGPRQVYGTFDNATADNGSPVNVPGWALYEEGGITSSVSGRYNVGNGSSTGGNGYSFGTSGDRAFGSLNDNSLTRAYVGGCFRNATGFPVTTVYIGFTGEMWRYGNGGITDTLDFQYAVNASNILQGTYLDFNPLDFATPNMTGSAGMRDGNAAANRTVVSPVGIPVALAPGDTFHVRWCDLNLPGVDDGLAIDDFSLNFFAPTGAGVTVSGRVLSGGGRGVANAVVKATHFSGQTVTTLTNPFGYYKFTDISAGESYVFEVSSKRFDFTNSSYYMNVLEDIENLDFIADN